MMRPKISIITPSFNAAQYIEQTILSILDQGYENLEFIIIDGGSNDGTVEIIKKYEDKISYWVSEKDNGQSDAINKGIKVATGDVFNWINADDYLLPGALNLVGQHFEDKSLEVLCTNAQLLHLDGRLTANGCTDVVGDINEKLNARGLNQQGMYWKMDCIKTLNGVNTAFNFAMDLDLLKRYYLKYGNKNIKVDDVHTAVFRLLDDSKTGSDFEGSKHLFDEENDAAIWQYAKVAGDSYLATAKYLYPHAKDSLAKVSPVCDLPQEKIAEWLSILFFTKAQEAFYVNDFKRSHALLKGVNSKYLKGEDERNFRSYKRWSSLKRWKA